MESSERIRSREKADDASCPPLSFPVRNPSEYGPTFISFSQPIEMGSYSKNEHGRYCHDQHQMKYLVMPDDTKCVHFDLNKGYDKFVRKNPNVSKTKNCILHWILEEKYRVIAASRGRGNADLKRFSAEFVCKRGLLTKIICTVYEQQDDWIICATKFKGTIYLRKFDTERSIKEKENTTERELLTTYWGSKFEQYMTTDRLYGRPNVETPVNENGSFCTVLKGSLGNNSLLYLAETDGVEATCGKSPANQYIELKTSRMITTDKQDWNFRRRKLLKWWAQSCLAGINKIICGFRDEEGIVRHIEIFRTADLPKIAKGLWRPSACWNFGNQFLQHVKEMVVKDDPYVVYKFCWQPGQDVTCEELYPAGEFQILPKWYINTFSSS